MPSSDVVESLVNFYSANCNGEWEHQFGVAISTIDNPGWSVTIDLVDTKLELQIFRTTEVSRTADDWFRCWSEAGKWQGRGGKGNLMELLQTFSAWMLSVKSSE